MVNNNDILNHIMEIKEDTAGIRQHLKDLNSKVATNVSKINCNEKDIQKVKISIAKYAGGMGAILIVLEVVLKFIV